MTRRLKENKFGALPWSFFLLIFLCFSQGGGEISSRLKEKLNKAITTSFEEENFSLQDLEPGKESNIYIPKNRSGDRLFAINTKDKHLGYAYLGSAPSMKKSFDYVILLNPDISIRKTKILIYREDHGRQIGSQRWLKQFIGLTPKDELNYGENIDAIVGATISAKSMTLAVTQVMQQLENLEEKSN